MQLGYSRRAFEEKFGISAATLQAWEDGKYETPVKGIARYIEALYRAGLATTQDWFMDGTGIPPRLIGSVAKNIEYSQSVKKNEDLSEDEIILREVTFFEQINNNPMIIMVSDDTMEPVFSVGDYVGGNLVSGQYASKYIGTLCIVKLDTGEIYARKLKFGSRNDLYNLVSINLDTNLSHAFLLDCRIISLAQIVWHRKTEYINE